MRHILFSRLYQRLSETGRLKKLSSENGHTEAVASQLDEQAHNKIEQALVRLLIH